MLHPGEFHDAVGATMMSLVHLWVKDDGHKTWRYCHCFSSGDFLSFNFYIFGAYREDHTTLFILKGWWPYTIRSFPFQRFPIFMVKLHFIIATRIHSWYNNLQLTVGMKGTKQLHNGKTLFCLNRFFSSSLTCLICALPTKRSYSCFVAHFIVFSHHNKILGFSLFFIVSHSQQIYTFFDTQKRLNPPP